ncbi:hypothetical protein LXL04_039571 [Taraxacum kok-saghyz]
MVSSLPLFCIPISLWYLAKYFTFFFVDPTTRPREPHEFGIRQRIHEQHTAEVWVPFIHSFGSNIRFFVLNLGFFTASLLPSSVSSTLTFIRLQVSDGYSHACLLRWLFSCFFNFRSHVSSLDQVLAWLVYVWNKTVMVQFMTCVVMFDQMPERI